MSTNRQKILERRKKQEDLRKKREAGFPNDMIEKLINKHENPEMIRSMLNSIMANNENNANNIDQIDYASTDVIDDNIDDI